MQDRSKTNPWFMLSLLAFSLVITAFALRIYAPSFAAWAPADPFAYGGPKWGVLARAPLAIQIHLGAAVATLVTGALMLALPKGTALHRAIGWACATLFLLAAASSFFIKQINDGSFSFLHILSVAAPISVGLGLLAARSRDVVRHKRAMLSMFVGLVLAGAFTLLPGRMMWHFVFG